MNFFYSNVLSIPLPDGHRFPGTKYRLLRDALIEGGTARPEQLAISPAATVADLTSVHDAGYVDAVLRGGLDKKQERQIGLPWSELLVRRTMAVMGGAIEAARSALRTGFSAQLSGGTHHAHRDFGSGYCVFNDFAIAASKALRERWVDRIAIVDLDVHQGDGNAALLGEREDIFILDLYCEKNFPFRKVAPHLGISLTPHLTDRPYLSQLTEALPAVVNFRPGLVLYQAGVDPLVHDALGHLDLSYEGLRARDRLVFETFKKAGIPVSLAIGGGYSKPISLSVEAYVNTFRTAKDVYGF